MNQVYVGKIVNTHGLKGELKVLSSFEYKNTVFKSNFKIYIDGREYTILRARDNIKHILITLKDLEDINLVEHLKNKNIYINRDDLNIKENDYIMEDLLDMEVVLNNSFYGNVIDYDDNTINKMIIIKKDEKNIIVPLNGGFIDSIDIKEKKIYLNERVKELEL